MNQAHWHLLLNHFPVVGTILCLLLLIAGVLRKSEEWKRAGLSCLVLVALLAIPAYPTGEPAEGVIEHLPDVSESLIEPHEAAAKFAILAALATGAVALFGLLRFRGPGALPTWLMTVMLLMTAWTVAVMAQTANLGGKIRHTEVRAGFTPGGGAGAPEGRNEKGHEEEERKEKR